MKILFVSPEFEEQGRGITGIIKAMIAAAKADGHEVGILAGYPDVSNGKSEVLDTKVEHIHLQHYIQSGKKSFLNHYPGGLKRRRNLLKIMSSRMYTRHHEFAIRQDYLTSGDPMLRNLDFCVKIPFCYQFINHGLEKLPKQVLKRAIKKYGIDLIITGAPMDLTKKEVAPAKLAQFVHDVMPIELMETPADNNTPQKFAKQMYAAAWESDIAMTNSKDTTNKVLEINNDAVTETLYGIASSKADEMPKTAILKQHHLTEGNYLLFISVIEKRKNLATLFEAYAAAYPKIKIPLVIVGASGYGYKDIANHRKNMPEEIRRNIIFTGFISEADKYMLLNNARAFVFPSIYEGIGLPIIEAYSSNLPVLTSNRGALPEAGGKAALYVENPYDIAEISEKIVQISTDESLRKKLRQHIPEQVEKFTREKFNQRFKEGLDKLR